MEEAGSSVWKQLELMRRRALVSRAKGKVWCCKSQTRTPFGNTRTLQTRNPQSFQLFSGARAKKRPLQKYLLKHFELVGLGTAVACPRSGRLRRLCYFGWHTLYRQQHRLASKHMFQGVPIERLLGQAVARLPDIYGRLLHVVL